MKISWGTNTSGLSLDDRPSPTAPGVKNHILASVLKPKSPHF